MDATYRAMCQEDLFNPLFSMGFQMSAILVLSHLFQLILKPLGQAGPIAQVLAGLVLGPTGLSNIKQIKEFFFQISAANYYELVSILFRILIVFVMGLEMDISYLRRNLRPASTIALGGSLMCWVIVATISQPVAHLLEFKGSKVAFAIILSLILANTASPVVVRVATDLKFATTDVGRLAITSSLITELCCVFLFALYSSSKHNMTKRGFLCFFLTAAAIAANKYSAARINKRNRNLKHLTKTEMALFLSFILIPGFLIETLGYNTMVSTFLIGILFPREGKSARTLLHNLSYCVHTLVLPIFLSYLGFQFNGMFFKNLRNLFLIILLLISSLGAKVIGTLAACHYLKLSVNEGNMVAFFMNLRGHTELVLLGNETLHTTDLVLRNLLVITLVMNTLIAGPVVAFLIGKEKDTFASRSMALELQDPDKELRMLACLYGPRHVSASTALISALSGSQKTPISPYLMHLVELPEKHKSDLLYHELEDGDEFSDEEDYGGNEALEINYAVDAFTTETGILIHQMKAVSPLVSLYEDVCNGAEDLHSSIVILPFHKHQRIDGKMENGKEGIRTTNHKVLRHAPCSVGIIVDRGLPAGLQQLLGSDPTVIRIATLFFGGPDDREALACSRLIATHPHINLTIIRFRQPTSPNEHDPDVGFDHSSSQVNNNEILMCISSNGHTDNQLDVAFLTDFYNRHVTSGQVGFVEKFVNNGAQTASALKDVVDMYSLFIVGRGGRGHSPMTTGMSDWEECPELGTVGDLLASADFNINGSVLVELVMSLSTIIMLGLVTGFRLSRQHKCINKVPNHTY